MSRIAPPPDYLITTLRFRKATFDAVEGLRKKIRANRLKNPPRSEIIRGCVEGILRSGIDLSDCTTSVDIRDRVAGAIRGKTVD